MISIKLGCVFVPWVRSRSFVLFIFFFFFSITIKFAQLFFGSNASKWNAFNTCFCTSA
jgi:hypothetical protein